MRTKKVIDDISDITDARVNTVAESITKVFIVEFSALEEKSSPERIKKDAFVIHTRKSQERQNNFI